MYIICIVFNYLYHMYHCIIYNIYSSYILCDIYITDSASKSTLQSRIATSSKATVTYVS